MWAHRPPEYTEGREAVWSSNMIRRLGRGGSAFEDRSSPLAILDKAGTDEIADSNCLHVRQGGAQGGLAQR